MWKEMQEDAKFENSQTIGCQVDCNKCQMKCRTTHNFQIKNYRIASWLLSMWKETQDNAQFQNQKTIEWQVDCNECGNRCKKTHNLKIHKCNKCGMNCRTTQILRLENDRIASRLQSMWKEMQDNAQFQNQKMIEWQVDCNECGNRCKKTHNLKIHKWSDVKSIAINVEWIAGQRTILRLENDRIASQLQSMWKEMQDNAQFENSQIMASRLQWMWKEMWDNSQIIRLWVNCNGCGKRCWITHFFKIRKW